MTKIDRDAIRKRIVNDLLLGLHPGSDADSRRARLMAMSDDAIVTRDMVQIGSSVLRHSSLDAIRAANGDKDAADRVEAWRLVDAYRAASADLDAMGGPGTGPVVLPELPGVGYSCPLIRSVAVTNAYKAAPWDQAPEIPAVPTGDDALAGFVDPPSDQPDDDPEDLPGFTVDSSGDATWHLAESLASVSQQVIDWTGPDGERMLDAIFTDVADHAAEKYTAAALEAAAGGTRAAGTDLAAALDDAEAAAGAGFGPVRYALCAPADWPRVRRAVAQSWSLQAGADSGRVVALPVPLVSSGATPGTVTMLGRGAMMLLSQPVIDRAAGIVKLSAPTLSQRIAVVRPFLLAIRDARQIQTVTLGA